MKKRSSRLAAALAVAAAIALGSSETAMAEETSRSLYRTMTPDGTVRELEWKTDDKGDWYQYLDDGSYPKGQWLWISSVSNSGYCSGTARCVYIKNDGYIYNSGYSKVYMATHSSDEAFKALDGFKSPDGYPVDISGAWINEAGTDQIKKEFPELKGMTRTVKDKNGETKTFYNDAAFSDYVHEKWNEQFDEEYIAKQVELAIEATNEQRRKKGRTELVYDESLDELAEQRAHQIADNFTHTLPEGGTVSKYHLAENIAAHSYNDVEPGKFAVNWLWMNSFGHKTNILAKNATKINIKAVVVPDSAGCPRWYWVQLFGFD